MTCGSTSNKGRGRAPARVALAVVALVLGASRPVCAADEEGCTVCHGLAGFAVREGGAARQLGLSAERFDSSAHGSLGCRECHLGVASIPHGDGVGDVGCGQSCHGLTIGGRDYSHEGLYWEYATSVHGGQGPGRVGCLVCHPEPGASEKGRDKVAEARLCAACHRANPRVRAWFADRHFRALEAGNTRAPSCPDCHTAHRVRAPSAPESTVNAGRLAETCARGALAPGGGCHERLVPGAAAAATMNPLPQARAGAGRLFTLFAALAIAGLLARAGIGLARGR